MNYDILKKQIKNKQINNIYLIYGDEHFLIEALIKKIQQEILGDNISVMTKNEFEGNVDDRTLLNALNTIPMIGKKKLVVCHNSGYFIGNSKHEKIMELVDNINIDTYIIFIEDKIKSANILFKKFKENNLCYNISKRKTNDIINYIITRFRKKNKKITKDNAYLFLDYSGAMLLDIESDIEKILLFMGDKIDVKKQYIKDLCQGSKDIKIYELTNSTFARNKEKSIKYLKEMLADKMPIQVIISTLNLSYMELYEVKLALTNNNTPKILRKNRPIHEYALKKLIENSKKYSLTQIRRIIKEIADTDINIKYGHINSITAIELLIMSITD